MKMLRNVTASTLAASVLLAGCGGGSGDRLSDEAFCAEMTSLEQRSEDLDEPELLAQIGRLAERAPNDELQGALQQVARLAEQLGALDEDDPDGFGEAMGLMFDPRNLQAMQTMESYLRDTCGLDLDSGAVLDDGGVGDDGTGDDFGDGSAFQDLDASDIREALRPAFESAAPGASSTGISIFSRGSAVVVQAQVFDAGDVDAMALCDALAVIVDDSTTDPDVEVEIIVDEDVAARRAPGGSCTPAQ